MMNKPCYIFVILLSVIFPIIVFSQSQTEEKLEIVNADTTMSARTERGILIKLIGNVHIKQGDAEMFCGQAEHWKDVHETIVYQNVKIYEKGKKLFADKVFYYNIPQIFKAVGKVVFKDSARQVLAREILYNRKDNRVEANHEVVLSDSINNVDIFGEHAEFDNNQGYALVTGAPILVKKDSTGKQEIKITSLKMELFEDGDKAVVTDSVHITQSKAEAICGSAEFYRKTNEIILQKNPIAWQGGDRLSGAVIHLFIQNNKLTKAIVKDQAQVTSVIDSTGKDQRVNILTGEQITMNFEQEELQQVIVETKATSYYHIYENNEYKGLNKIIGDKISVFLKDRRIDQIIVSSNPQLSSGVYYPPGKEPEPKELRD